MVQIPSWEANWFAASQVIPRILRNPKVITALTSVRHLSLSWASPIQSTYPHPTSWKSILILSTHLRLGLPSGLFPSGFPTTYLLTPWCRVFLEKLTGLQLVKKFPAFYGTRRFITALKSIRHLSLSWASPIHSTYLHPTSWRSILILSTHLRLGLPSGLFPSGFPIKTLYAPLSSPIRATCPAHMALHSRRLISSRTLRETQMSHKTRNRTAD